MGDSIAKYGEIALQNTPGLGIPVVVEIPLTADLETILIKLDGSVTISGAPSALITDGIANLIDMVELIADGRDTIISIPFNQLVNGNMFRKKQGSVSQVLQPLLTVAAQPFSVQAMLDLAAFGAIRPKDSNLRENSYKTLQLKLRFNPAWSAVFTGGTFSAQTINLAIFAAETIELQDAAGNSTRPIFRACVSGRDDQFTGAVVKKQIRLTPEQLLRGISLRVVNASGVLSDTILSAVRVYVGKDLRYTGLATNIKALNNTTMQSLPGVGYYFLNFASEHGAPDRLNDGLDLRNVKTLGADCIFEYDSSAQGVVNIVQYGYTGL